MIKHWEILENIWTSDSAYVLGISGEEQDVALITKELSSFCSLIDVQVPKFTHIFELLNVTDDDILQKIRKKVEDIVSKSSASEKLSFGEAPVIVSKNSDVLYSKEVKPEDIFSDSSENSNGLSSSDGTEIDISHASSTNLEKHQTFRDDISPKDQKQKTSIVRAPRKKENKGFFKKLFSFGKKQEKKE